MHDLRLALAAKREAIESAIHWLNENQRPTPLDTPPNIENLIAEIKEVVKTMKVFQVFLRLSNDLARLRLTRDR